MLDVRESGRFLRLCQVPEGEIAGTECPWELNMGMPPREDFHDTMQAIYVWSLSANFDENREYIERALSYLKSRRKFLMEEKEPMKSYDATCMLLGLHMYLKQEKDREIAGLERYAVEHLTNYFTNGDGPVHKARDYSNPYLRAGILGYVLRDLGESTAFLDGWLSRDTALVMAEEEPPHRGPGYQFPHDFVSTFGSKLFALGVVSRDYDFSSALSALPRGFVEREIDVVSFNSTILMGLGAAKWRTSGELRDSFVGAAVPIRENLESRIDGGGLKRGSYFPIRESWPTFFLTFATIVFDFGDPFRT